jgi:hypothetical protein
MQAYSIDRFGTVDGIVLRSSDDSRPGTEGGGDASARELAQHHDLIALKGGGRDSTKLGVIPLSDGAGEIAPVAANGRSRSRKMSAADDVSGVPNLADRLHK